MKFEEQFPELKDKIMAPFTAYGTAIMEKDTEGYINQEEIQKHCISKERFSQAIDRMCSNDIDGSLWKHVQRLEKELNVENDE